MRKAVNIERIKTLSIVVLFITTILLLYFLWKDTVGYNKSILSSKIGKGYGEHNIFDFIEPSEIIAGFGGDSYTVIAKQTKEHLNAFIPEFIDFSKSENIYAQEITQEKWNQIMNYKSIQYKFDYPMPFSEMAEAIGAGKVQAFDKIDTISIIGYSSAYPDSLFIYGGKNKYYWLASDFKQRDINKIITDIEISGYDRYYPMKTITGIDNFCLLPLYNKYGIQKLACNQEIKSFEEEKINKLAEDFFGESFDFIRKIVENDGTVIYMYGYGQKMLIINSDGSLEYKEDVSAESGEEGNFIESFGNAVEFISQHGGFDFQNESNIRIYLKNYKELKNPKGYRFIFGYTINDFPVHYTEKEPIIVDIAGSQVISYKRYILDVRQSDKDEESAGSDSQNEILPIIDVLTKNCRQINDILLNQDEAFKEEDVEAAFTNAGKQIRDVRIGYYVSEKESGTPEKFVPAWIVYTDKVIFYFDIKTGDLLGHSPNDLEG